MLFNNTYEFEIHRLHFLYWNTEYLIMNESITNDDNVVVKNDKKKFFNLITEKLLKFYSRIFTNRNFYLFLNKKKDTVLNNNVYANLV